MDRSGKEQRSGRGRHRGVYHDAEALDKEEKAKGHTHKRSEPGRPEPPNPREATEERGHQKGYGRNQDQEGEAKFSRHGTRPQGNM
ncbi:MAG TPA: hypothetical protein V6D22_05625 [Candidatus Obscuribacterales bacterium]